MFSKASWLERIHNNGGRPIYENGGAARKTARPRRAAAPGAAPAAARAPPAAAPTAARRRLRRPLLQRLRRPPLRRRLQQLSRCACVRPAPPAFPGSAPPPAPPLRLLRLLHLRTETRLGNRARQSQGVPAAGELCSLRDRKDGARIGRHARRGARRALEGAADFAVLTISAKELRLGLALAGAAVEAPYQAAKAASFPADHGSSLTHMAVLNDARQINDALLARVREAADRVG